VEYCENLIFRRRAALDELGDRLLDANRSIGRPDKLTVLFGRRVNQQYQGKLQTEIEDLHLGNAVMRSYYKNRFAKHYDILRIEAATNNVNDYHLNKGVDNLAALRDQLQGITTRYQEVQQDILETFLDCGELRNLALPTVLANGRRIPGLKLDHPRQLAVMSSLVRFSHVAAGDTLSKIVRWARSVMSYRNCEPKAWLPNSPTLALSTSAHRICLLFLKLFENIYAPLTAGLLHPYRGDRTVDTQGRKNTRLRLRLGILKNLANVRSQALDSNSRLQRRTVRCRTASPRFGRSPARGCRKGTGSRRRRLEGPVRLDCPVLCRIASRHRSTNST
jgi:hypothetical protein